MRNSGRVATSILEELQIQIHALFVYGSMPLVLCLMKQLTEDQFHRNALTIEMHTPLKLSNVV